MARSRIANLDSLPTRKAEFIEPMECALVSKLPEGTDWTYEVKASASRIDYFVFDLLVLHGRDPMKTPLTKRRELMKSVLKLPSQGIRVSEQFDIATENMLSVRHSKFVVLRDDKKPSEVLKEG